MKSSSKQILSLVLAICLCLTMMPVLSQKANAVAPTVFYQTDSRWGSHQYGYSDSAGTEPATISSAGCGILSYVNAVYYLTGNFIDPIYLADWSVNNGHRVNGVGTAHSLFQSFAAACGASYDFEYVGQYYSYSSLADYLKKGYVTIFTVPNHVMACVDYDESNGEFLVLDSYPSSKRGTSNGYAWKTQQQMIDMGASISSYFYVIKSISGISGGESTRQSDSTYGDFLPLVAFPISSDHISVYDEHGSVLSNRYIDGATDVCIIWDIYTDGWCKVSYPSSAEESGYYTAYVPFSEFVDSPNPTAWTSDKEYIAYRKSEMQELMVDEDMAVVASGVSCLAVGGAGETRQVIYPIDGREYYAMGWISTPKEIHISTDVLTMSVGETKTVYASSTGYYHGATSLVFGKKEDTIDCKWGEWAEGKVPLYITAKEPGTVLVAVGVKADETGDILDAIGLTVIVTANCDDGHSYGDWYTVKDASCTECGQERRDCGNCDHYETRDVAEKGHDYKSVVTAPTCEEKGYTTHTCTVCGDSYIDSYVDATGHSYGEWKEVKAPTTTETGLAERTCVNCGEKEQKVLDKLPDDPNGPKVVVESVSATAGETISIPVYIENNTGVAYAKFKLDYSDGLELISVENKGLLTGTFTTSKTLDTKPYVLQWMGADDATSNGCFLMLTFRVSEDAAAGDYQVTILCEEAYNSAFADVTFGITNGTVTVKDFIPGDVNGDGIINGKDGILLAQFLAEWDVTINMNAADVNGDGTVNGKDGILLAQFLAEWDVTLG